MSEIRKSRSKKSGTAEFFMLSNPTKLSAKKKSRQKIIAKSDKSVCERQLETQLCHLVSKNKMADFNFLDIVFWTKFVIFRQCLVKSQSSKGLKYFLTFYRILDLSKKREIDYL